MRLRRRKIGEMNITSPIDITDPCYDKDTWCRMNDVEIKHGTYQCIVWRSVEAITQYNKHYTDKRVGIIALYHKELSVIPDQNQMEEIGVIGVDAGLAGFFINKPDYKDEEWYKFVDELGSKKDAWLNDKQFFSSSGYGDGAYPVYASKDSNGNINAIEIRFM